MLYLFGWKENEPDGQFTLTTKLSSYEVCRKIITKTKENNILTMYDVCTLSDHISNNLVESDIPSAALVSPNKGQWFLDGVSHLPKIKNNSPLVHSKVSNYLEWIDANTEKRGKLLNLFLSMFLCSKYKNWCVLDGYTTLA